MYTETAVWRAIDASANRAFEGLRVVEDFLRFALDDAHLTTQIKNLRHQLATTCAGLPLSTRHAARDTQQDVGTQITTVAETQRTDAWDVCQASLERTKQSFRSLEEFSKVTSPEISSQFESLRYQLYTLERSISITQDSLTQLENVQLYVLVDGRNTEEHFAALIEQLIAAGVGAIQLRDKQLSDAELVGRAHCLRKLTQKTTLAIINDRPDIAAATHADGVHLGQDDLGVKEARAILGPHKLIGISTHSIDQARVAVLDGANYLGAGPTFPSTTKTFDSFPGLDFLQQVAAEIRLPTFAIGGINTENLSDALATGITRVAVGGAIVGARDPTQVLGKFLQGLRSAEARRPTATGSSR